MRSSPSTVTKKREVLSREARIQSILEASQRVFASRPYDEISIDEIAVEASMSKGLLYHYFASKRALYLETLRSVLTMISQNTEECSEPHACLNALLSHFEQAPALARMVFRGGIGSDTEVEALLTAHRQHQFTLFFQSVATVTQILWYTSVFSAGSAFFRRSVSNGLSSKISHVNRFWPFLNEACERFSLLQSSEDIQLGERLDEYNLRT